MVAIPYENERCCSIVELGGLFEFRIAGCVMLDPELRARFFQERFDGGSRGDGLLDIEFGGGQAIEFALFGIVVQVAADEHRAGVRQPEKEHLMTGRMPGRGLNDHGFVPEDVVFVLLDDHRFAGFERAEKGRNGARRGYRKT